ncbi:MAG TPA: ABC transporter permease [Candidatus Rothia avicola]|uniref:ABC transporter permease n=1 Tax=Candidatus Rothia avicola TaxID=2840478 RepID=A0A9D1ZUW3_9MICC|nr:ABC transporter permease [Candidatus Rothia avicola]
MNTAPKNAWQIVATREIMVKLRDKSFIGGTIFSLVIILAAILIPYFMSSGSTDYTVATSDDRATSLVAAAEASSDENTSYTAIQVDSADAARTLVTEGDADAYLAPTDQGWELVFDSSPDNSLVTELSAVITSTVTAENAAAAGVDLEALAAGTQVSTSVLSGNSNAGLAFLIAMVFAMIFYMTTVLFGVAIANSVVEEKQNRIVEIIATAIPLGQLLAGKIVGNIVLAILQVAIYAVAGLIGMQITGSASEFGWILPSVGWFALFYIVGFAAIATIWAAVGAMAARTEDIANLSNPITMVLIAALFAGIYVSGTWLKIVSFVPVLSSIAMPRRLLTEDVALWEPLIALTLTLATAALLTRLGARIYRANIMRGGTSVSWKQALKK